MQLLCSFAVFVCGPLSFSSPALVQGQAEAAQPVPVADQVYLLVRSDDAGMSRSVDVALEKLIESGFPVSVSVMFP